MKELNVYKARVVKVVDGDTLDLEVDLGFHAWVKERFRLYGVNCGEKFGVQKAQGLEAKAFAETTLLGKEVLVKTFKPDKYGRWLAEVYPDGLERSFNKMLLLKNLAVVYFGEARDLTKPLVLGVEDVKNDAENLGKPV